MIAYQYDEKTNMYVGEKKCQLDPLTSALENREVYLLPANCTYASPLDAKAGFDIQYNLEKDSWEYVKKINLYKQEYEETIEDKIHKLKMNLTLTDYIVIKIAEQAATFAEYADVIEQRKNWRAEINRLEAEIHK